jgi:phage-related protein
MKKYIIMSVSLAAIFLMISTVSAVPQVQSQFTLKRLNKSEEIQRLIDQRIKSLEEIKNKDQLMKNNYEEALELIKIYILDIGMLGPFLDWLINLINSIINLIQTLIDFISDLLSLANLIDLLIESIQQLISMVQQLIQWIIDLFNPNIKVI